MSKRVITVCQNGLADFSASFVLDGGVSRFSQSGASKNQAIGNLIARYGSPLGLEIEFSEVDRTVESPHAKRKRSNGDPSDYPC